MAQKPVNLCEKHAIPYAFTCEECPMCTLINDFRAEVKAAEQRGFLKGVEAGKIEAAREAVNVSEGADQA